jgi:heme-degrading monooxygenase HmoA
MESVITRVVLNEGAGTEWEAAMRERMTAAESSPGWIAGSILTPEDDRDARVVMGLWETRADWERWHRDPEFRDVADQLEGLQREHGEPTWHEVVYSGGRFPT